jgi:hypothetical protein
MPGNETILAFQLFALTCLFTSSVSAQEHRYQGTLGIWFESVNDYDVNDTDGCAMDEREPLVASQSWV